MDLKKRIIDFNKSGKSLVAISKQLQVPRSTVHTIVCRYKVHGTVASLPLSGRKRKPSPATERKMVRMVKNQQSTIKKQVCNELEAAGTQVSVSTVKRVLHHYGLRGCRAGRKPSLQKRHIEARLKFAADQMDEEKAFWSKVLGSEETQMYLFGHNYQQYVGGEKVRPLTPTSPCLPSSMVVLLLCAEHVLLPMELVLFLKSME